MKTGQHSINSRSHHDKANAKGINRRSFLKLAFGGTLSLLSFSWLGALFKYLKPPERQGFGGKVYAGQVSDFPEGTIRRVLQGRFYIVSRAGGLLAVYQKCTHLGCSVPWDETETIFHCPCHGSLFNEVGEVIGGPAPRPLDIFPISIVDGEVWVDTGNPAARSRFEPDQLTRI